MFESPQIVLTPGKLLMMRLMAPRAAIPMPVSTETGCISGSTKIFSSGMPWSVSRSISREPASTLSSAVVGMDVSAMHRATTLHGWPVITGRSDLKRSGSSEMELIIGSPR